MSSGLEHKSVGNIRMIAAEGATADPHDLPQGNQRLLVAALCVEYLGEVVERRRHIGVF